MRSALSTILQTLTPESSIVLNNSIAEAGRRNHSQTTPLHVAATLLAAPTGFLRQACIRSHPNSSHPLQCRALELCFSVALERLPNATQSPAVSDPPVSNALMAALKRAQAHQRRGCPEQQQQPLLAVKVELEQLMISVLDDPSVSRVMREAGFSSPAVKTTIEKSLAGNIFRPSPVNRNLHLNSKSQINDETSLSSSSPTNFHLNPRLQQKHGNLSLNHFRNDDFTRVIEIMSKSKKKNPILVGEFEPNLIKKEILTRIQEFKNAEVISMEFPEERSEIPAKINKIIELIRIQIRSFRDNGVTNRRIIVDLGDLKWLAEKTPTRFNSDIDREFVSEMAKLVTEFGRKNDEVWLIGTATYETYLRCQVYHPSLENDWDLQALPISSGSCFFGRFGTNGIFGSSLESLNSAKNSARMLSCCPKCFHDYELEKSSLEAKNNLPRWLQNAKAQCSETEAESDMKMPHEVNEQELLQKWIDICSKIHPNHNQNPRFLNMVTGFEPNRLLRKSQSGRPPSPVHTDLVLGPNPVHDDFPAKDFLRCISSEPQDTDSFKKLFKGLMKTAWWQPDAASTMARTVTRCGSRGGMWLLFAGPDPVGKKKMASVLARHVYGAEPVTVCFGSRREIGFRGKTGLDHVFEAVRENPFSLIVLSDIDEADMLVRGSVKKAMESGRVTDSHGREISVGNVVFVLTGNWSLNKSNERFLPSAGGDRKLKLAVFGKRSKRQPDWLPETNTNTSTKHQKKATYGLSLDLKLSVDVDEDRTDVSDLTIEQGDENPNPNPHFTETSVSVPHDLVGPSDGLVVFKPVQFEIIRQEIEKTIKNSFSAIVDEKLSVEVNEEIVDNVLRELWFGKTDLDDWVAQILVPSVHELVRQNPSVGDDSVVRIELD